MVYLFSESVGFFVFGLTGIQEKIIHVSLILKLQTRTKRLSSSVYSFASRSLKQFIDEVRNINLSTIACSL